jgi:hypothetical protein
MSDECSLDCASQTAMCALQCTRAQAACSGVGANHGDQQKCTKEGSKCLSACGSDCISCVSIHGGCRGSGACSAWTSN